MIKIADYVFKQQEIFIGEDDEQIQIVLRQNTISRQRRFIAQWDKNAAAVKKVLKAREEAERTQGEDFDPNAPEWQVDQWENWISLCGIALEKQLAPHVDKMYGANQQLTKEYRTFLEDRLDDETITEIIETGTTCRQSI